MSVDLDLCDGPHDLMTKFIDCLVLLPNLKALEVFCHRQFLAEIGWESTRFPSVRELVVEDATATLVGCCPNVESVVVTNGLYSDDPATLNLHGKRLEKLKRFVGVRVPSIELGELKVTLV